MTDAQQPAAEPVTSEPVEPGTTSATAGSDRPRPGPSPTSRARRAAAAGVQSAASPTRRPSPRPAHQADAGKVTLTKPAQASTAEASAARIKPVRSENVEAAQPHRVRARSPRWLAVLLAVLAVLLAGTSAWMVIVAPGRAGSVNQRDQALSSAKSSVALILSYDYRTFDAGLAKAQAQLTGRANSDYVQAMTSTIKPAALKSKVVVQAQTDSAGVETVSADGKQVTVVVFGQQKVTNTALSSPRIDPFRVRATMNLVAGHWLVSKFDQI
jgi:Mce-associated membrane protein